MASSYQNELDKYAIYNMDMKFVIIVSAHVLAGDSPWIARSTVLLSWFLLVTFSNFIDEQ